MKQTTRMGTWKMRVLRKKNRGSQTTGRSKGLVPTALQRWMCRHGRSYKHNKYAEIMASLGKRDKKK